MARPRRLAPSPESLRSPTPVSRPVSRDSVQDQIYAELSDALICGRLQGGQTLQIRDLADAFHTSVMPVREALRRLVAEGALESATQQPVREEILLLSPWIASECCYWAGGIYSWMFLAV